MKWLTKVGRKRVEKVNKATLEKANSLQGEIYGIKDFLNYCKCNRNIRFFKKKGITATVSDYMREVRLFELSNSQRDKFIKMLEEELAEKEKELEELQ